MKELASAKARTAGIQQTLKAITQGRAQVVYLAQDADPELMESIRKAAQDKGLPIREVPTMKELGVACRIQVKAAAAAILKG